MNEHVNQVRNLRNLCQLMVEQQENVLRLISDKLDAFEAELLGLAGTGKDISYTAKDEKDTTASNEAEEGADNGK